MPRMSLSIRPCTVSEWVMSPTFDDMIARYAEESAMGGMPKPVADVDMYFEMEAAGVYHIIGAFDGDDVVGMLNMVLAKLTHYGGAMSATTESYFVEREYRKRGAGIRLLRAAEEHAAALGATALFVSARCRSDLEWVMYKMADYTATNTIFFRSLT